MSKKSYGGTGGELGSFVEGLKIPLGTTQTGKDWCMKALHPSCVIGPTRVPDGGSEATIAQAAMSTWSVPAPVGIPAGNTWNVDFFLMSHPIIWGTYLAADSTGTYINHGVMLNPELPGTGATAYKDKLAFFCQNYSEYRMTHESGTFTMNCADMTNQGTVAAGQYDMLTKKFIWRPTSLTVGKEKEQVCGQGNQAFDSLVTQASEHAAKCAPPTRDEIGVLRERDGRGPPNVLAVDPIVNVLGEAFMTAPVSYAALQTLRACYGPERAVDGVYVPMYVYDSLRKYRSTCEVTAFMGHLSSSTGPAWSPFDYSTYAANPTKVAGTQIATPGNQFPFFDFGSTGMTSMSQTTLGAPLIPFCEKTIGQVSFRGLHSTSTLDVCMRVGLELKAYPGTTVVQYAQMCPPRDELAMQAYDLIRRELKDAYPGSYNLFGLLGGAIAGLAKSVLPKIPVIGGFLGKLVGSPAAASTMSGIAAAMRADPKGRLPPAAQERVASTSATVRGIRVGRERQFPVPPWDTRGPGAGEGGRLHPYYDNDRFLDSRYRKFRNLGGRKPKGAGNAVRGMGKSGRNRVAGVGPRKARKMRVTVSRKQRPIQDRIPRNRRW